MQLEGHRCFIQPETKKRKPSHEVEEEEEESENGYDVSAFFDTECRQGEREPEDEPVEESLQESCKAIVRFALTEKMFSSYR